MSVYIQANEHGKHYEVGWKNLITGETSISKETHEIAPTDAGHNYMTPKVNKELEIMVNILIPDENVKDDRNYLKSAYKNLYMANYF